MRRVCTITAVICVALGIAACTRNRPEIYPPPPLAVPRFYDPPNPLPARDHGFLIRSEPVPTIPGARAWRVLYLTELHDGRRTAASALVITPSEPPPTSGRPVVAFAHGTTGVERGCAPSLAPAPAVDYVANINPAAGVPFNYGVAYLTPMIAAGYTVVAPDYQGLGGPGAHEYLVARSEAHAVLDAVRAARQLPEANAGASTVLLGHSQGGHAVLAATEDPGYASDVPLLGAAALAPVTDVAALVSLGMTEPAARGVMFSVIHGYADAFGLFPGFLTDEGASFEKGTVSNECILAVSISAVQAELDDYIVADPTTYERWQRAFGDNSLGNVRATAPVLVAQGTDDELVASDRTAAYVARACARGSNVSAQVETGADHGTIVTSAQAAVLAWIADRFAGVPARSGC